MELRDLIVSIRTELTCRGVFWVVEHLWPLIADDKPLEPIFRLDRRKTPGHYWNRTKPDKRRRKRKTDSALRAPQFSPS